METIPSGSEPLEGCYFDLRDLQAAMAWATSRPDIHLSLRLNDPHIPEIIQVGLPGSDAIRWCIWRDHIGLLRFDDWVAGRFDLPYPTVKSALRFIASTLAIGSRP